MVRPSCFENREKLLDGVLHFLNGRLASLLLGNLCVLRALIRGEAAHECEITALELTRRELLGRDGRTSLAAALTTRLGSDYSRCRSRWASRRTAGRTSRRTTRTAGRTSRRTARGTTRSASAASRRSPCGGSSRTSRFAQTRQALLELADLTTHFRYIPTEIARGHAAIFDQTLQHILCLTRGKRPYWLVPWSCHVLSSSTTHKILCNITAIVNIKAKRASHLKLARLGLCHFNDAGRQYR